MIEGGDLLVELRDYIRILRKRWQVVALLALLCLAGASAGTLLATPSYQSTTQVFVSTQGGADAAQLLQGGNFTQQRVKSYSDIVTSPLVLDPVIAQLGLRMTSEQLAQLITADAPTDTVLINVVVRSGSPTQAQQIADAVGKQFARVIGELEKPDGGEAALVKVSIVQPADLNTVAVSPSVKRNLGLGLVVGLVLGIGVAVLRELLDTSVKGQADVLAIAALPVLGGINFDSNASRRPLIVQDDPHSPRAEAFRQLRTNLQFVDVANHPRSIVFTSSVPEEGKSTTTANLVITLAAAGSRTVLVEADLRRPRVADYLGLEGAAGLTNVLIGQAELDDVLQPWGNGMLDVLACGPIPPNPSELLGSQAMDDLLRELEAQYDYVIIDAPPLLPVTDAAVMSRLAGGAVVVVGANRINRDQLRRAFDILETVGAQVLGVVMNLVPTKGPDSYSYYSEGYQPITPDQDKRRVRSARQREATRQRERSTA